MGKVVNAYIKVTGGRYEWLLEYKGYESRGSGSAGGDRMRAAIMALGEMLEHMTRPSVIDLQINEMNIANYINQGWLGKWKANNWENSHGAKIKHADLWKQVRFQEHAIRAKYERGLMIPGGQE